jgi:hypothetical protein
MDLAEITTFIALDNPARAFEFEEELLEHARRIGRAPHPAWVARSGNVAGSVDNIFGENEKPAASGAFHFGVGSSPRSKSYRPGNGDS